MKLNWAMHGFINLLNIVFLGRKIRKKIKF